MTLDEGLRLLSHRGRGNMVKVHISGKKGLEKVWKFSVKATSKRHRQDVEHSMTRTHPSVSKRRAEPAQKNPPNQKKKRSRNAKLRA